MGEKRKSSMEADHGDDRQSPPPVQGGNVRGKASAFCDLLLLMPCPGTHTIHPLWRANSCSLDFTSQKKLAMREEYCLENLSILQATSDRGAALLPNATVTYINFDLRGDSLSTYLSDSLTDLLQARF
jgi:hypothetical protein